MTHFCTECMKRVETKVVEKKETNNIKGILITKKFQERVCKECGEKVYDIELEDEKEKIFYDEYYAQKGLLRPEEIKAIREKYGLTQVALAKLLRLGEKTIARYENGAIQDPAIDTSIRLLKNVDVFLKLYALNKNYLSKDEKLKMQTQLCEMQYQQFKKLLLTNLWKKDAFNPPKCRIDYNSCEKSRHNTDKNNYVKCLVPQSSWSSNNLSIDNNTKHKIEEILNRGN